MLKSYRERERLSKKELADKLGLSQGYILNIENENQPPPTLARCKEIAKILGLNEEEEYKLIFAAFEDKYANDDFVQMFLRTKKTEYESLKKLRDRKKQSILDRLAELDIELLEKLTRIKDAL